MLGGPNNIRWALKNCPTAWHGQFKVKEKKPTVSLEAICDRSLCIWHLFFGIPGTPKDITIVKVSPLINKIVAGTFPPSYGFRVAGFRRNKQFWFDDSIFLFVPLFITKIATTERMHWLLSTDRGFDLFTDYNNLFFLFDPTAVIADLSQTTTRKVLRWALRLSVYNYV